MATTTQVQLRVRTHGRSWHACAKTCLPPDTNCRRCSHPSVPACTRFVNKPVRKQQYQLRKESTYVQANQHTRTHTQSHSYNSHPKVYTAQDPISTRVCGCLAAPSPFVPSNHHHIYTDFVGRGLITGHESCAFEQHPAQFVQ